MIGFHYKRKAQFEGGKAYNFGGKSSHESSTTSSSSNSSDSYTSNTSTNTSLNTTDNNTNTVTQDRRLVNDRGIGVSADNSTVTTSNSNNSVSSVSNNYTTTDFGAVQASIASNTALASKTVDASMFLGKTGQEMLSANLTFAKHISDTGAAEARNAIREVTAAAGNALNQVTSIAAKPLNAQNPQQILVIVGLVVVGVVVFSKLKG